jgi:hypothetical protein
VGESGTKLDLPAEGGCQCGEVRYRIDGQPLWLSLCHCNECKRQSGAAFGMSLRLKVSDVSLLRGVPKTWTRLADSGGEVECAFCPNCGTRVWHDPVGSGFRHVKPGTLDEPAKLAPPYEAWTKRKAQWLSIAGLRASFIGQPPTPAAEDRSR